MARTCTKKKWKYDSSGLRLTYKSKCIAIGNKQTRSDTNKHSPSNWNNRIKSWSLTKNVIPGFCSQKCTTGICDCSSLIGIHDSFKACNSFNMHVPHRQCTQSHDVGYLPTMSLFLVFTLRIKAQFVMWDALQAIVRKDQCLRMEASTDLLKNINRKKKGIKESFPHPAASTYLELHSQLSQSLPAPGETAPG